jgi:dCMP deaminase
MRLDKWDQRFLNVANEVANWSKDPGTCVGSVLVKDRRILATGYNGFPAGLDDSLERYSNRELKLAYTVHAEVNALLNAAKNGAETKGSTLYVTFPPCVNCATCIAQAGVERVVCPDVDTAPERWKDNFLQGQSVLAEIGVSTTTFIPSSNGQLI